MRRIDFATTKLFIKESLIDSKFQAQTKQIRRFVKDQKNRAKFKDLVTGNAMP